MKAGAFQSVEDVLTQSLETSLPVKPATPAKSATGTDLIAALQASPYREIESEPARYRPPVGDVAF